MQAWQGCVNMSVHVKQPRPAARQRAVEQEAKARRLSAGMSAHGHPTPRLSRLEVRSQLDLGQDSNRLRCMLV